MTIVAYIKLKTLTKIIIVLDSASATTTIDMDFAEIMNLELRDMKDKNFSYVDRKATVSTASCTAEVISQDQKRSFIIDCTAIKGFSNNCCVWPWSIFKNKHDHLKHIDIPSYPDPPLGRILIGVDHPDLLVITEYAKSKHKDRPMAAKTPLGWSFFGPDPPGEFANQIFTYQENKKLSDIVSRQFEIENIGAKEPCQPYKTKIAGPKHPDTWSPRERLADALMTVYLNKDKLQLVGKIPWKENHEAKLMGNSKAVETRQSRTHTSIALNRKGITLEEIESILNGYLTKDYIEEVKDSEKNTGWYLPFFEVVNRTKSTPIRLVFDAKAKYKDVSLNKLIMDTPNRLNDITIVLTRMRKHRFIFAGDISEMFLQIRLDKDDRKFHRFINNGKHYQFKRILFGNKASPNISQKALETLCTNYKEYDEAIETLTKSCYMDDCIDSRKTEKELATLAKQLPELLLKGGMKICKIFTNSPEARSLIPTNIQAKSLEMEDKNFTYEDQKVLGMAYCVETDHFTYNIKHKTLACWKKDLNIQHWTKRNVLKVTASHYDPLGLASPITIMPRRFLQLIWTTKVGWDEKLQPEISQEWEKTLTELLNIQHLKIPRYLKNNNNQDELHIFCDASAEVYACVIYLRNCNDSTSNIVAGKARVTPIKLQSVSRAELDACVLGCRMGNHYKDILNIEDNKVFYYSDSTNVLNWISCEPKRLSVFVQRRVAEIQTWTSPDKWSHVATSENPADVATRPTTVEFIGRTDLWLKGPLFLRDPAYSFKHFVNSSDNCQGGEILLKLTDGVDGDNYLDNLAEKYSVGKLYNGWIRFNRILKRATTWKSGSETVENLLWRASQMKSYDGDPKNKKLKKLSAFKDTRGIIRSNSRLINGEDLPYDTKYPIILDTTSAISRLLVQKYHHKFKHGVGTGLFLSQISRKFIIQGLRKYEKVIEKTCLFCHQIRGVKGSQHMGPLPADLLRHEGRPFSVIGIDFAGPFQIKGTGRGSKPTQKYILVITCLHIRAIHFELCRDQTAETIVKALVRFSCLRGDPRIIYSDNQPSFIKAGKDIGAWIPEANIEEIKARLEEKRDIKITWKTITSRTPHQGGRWERMVRSMKRALTATQNAHPTREDEFITILAEASDMLNSRPLTKALDSEECLTPNHFLYGRATVNLLGNAPCNNHYKKLQQIMEKLWERFIGEILIENREASKWTENKENITIGDLALIMDPAPIKGEWRMGLVTNIFPGKDGKIRNLELRSNEKTIKRSIFNLIPVPKWDPKDPLNAHTRLLKQF